MTKKEIRDVCLKLNELKKEYNPFADKNKSNAIKEEVKNLLNSIPTRTKLGHVIKRKISYYTSHGSHYGESTEIIKYQKEKNNNWLGEYSMLKPAEDMVLSILYNTADIMLYEDAEKLSKIKRLSDKEYFTSYAIPEANILTQSEYKFSNLIPTKDFTIEDTGGHTFVIFGKFTRGNYFVLSDDILVVYDSDYYKKAYLNENVDDYEFYTKHSIAEFDYNSIEYKQVLKMAYDKCNENLRDIPLFIEFNQNKDNEIEM